MRAPGQEPRALEYRPMVFFSLLVLFCLFLTQTWLAGKESQGPRLARVARTTQTATKILVWYVQGAKEKDLRGNPIVRWTTGTRRRAPKRGPNCRTRMSVQRCQLDELGGKCCWTYSEAVSKGKKKQGGKKLPFAMQTPEYCNRVECDEFEENQFALSEEVSV